MEYRNARRSKRLIREAFAELAKEKGTISKITVKEIVDRADISKSTFYVHYDDVYSLLEEFENELLSAINQSIEDYFASNDKNFKLYTNKLINIFKQNDSLYRKLFCLDINNTFVDKIKKMIKKELIKYLPEEFNKKDPKKFTFYLNFFTNGINETIVDYYKGNIDLSLDDIGEYANEILERVINYVNNESKKLSGV